MNTLEQLKRAKEGEPVAVLVIGKMPECCIGDCIFWENRICDACYAKEHKPIFDDDFGNDESDFNKRPDWCELRKAIALIEPDGHLVCLGEVEE